VKLDTAEDIALMSRAIVRLLGSGGMVWLDKVHPGKPGRYVK
jgi:hypothetical protein